MSKKALTAIALALASATVTLAAVALWLQKPTPQIDGGSLLASSGQIVDPIGAMRTGEPNR